MTPDQLNKIVEVAKCRVYGWRDAGTDSHRAVLGALIVALGDESSTVLCEPSLAHSTSRPPDIVVISQVGGLHVIEVKGIELSDVRSIEPGGHFTVQYAGGTKTKNPFHQAGSAMFHIKDAVERIKKGATSLPFQCWVLLPRIARSSWQQRWGEAAPLPPELLFRDDLPGLADRLIRYGKERLRICSRSEWPENELTSLRLAFGDSSVLYPRGDEREQRTVKAATLGEKFDEAAEGYKTLSDEQHRLSTQAWERGPRLVRGVAGSGKTIVLANNLARRIERHEKLGPTLFEKHESGRPRILAVCFNRTLVPFIRRKIDIAYRQRTGNPLPETAVEVSTFNSLLYRLKGKAWKYRPFDDGSSPEQDERRAQEYLADLQLVKKNEPGKFERFGYDAIYVDEGQDFVEGEFQLLGELCVAKAGEPSLFVFYDDAQNLYGRKRPNWQSIGLNVLGGRSNVMTKCFRNTRQIIEPAFNVLYGTYAADKTTVPTKAFGDIATMEEKGLLRFTNGAWCVEFACRHGERPEVVVVPNAFAENVFLANRIRRLVEKEDVRPQDILVLSCDKRRASEIADCLKKAEISGLHGVRVAFEEKDSLLSQRGYITVSTVASAKGYDAYCVFLASADRIRDDVRGRASFYVGCTRAIENLVVSGASERGLLAEMQRACS